MKILQKENTQYFVKDFNENRCSIKEAALNLTLYFLREMKQDGAANSLEGKRFMSICQIMNVGEKIKTKIKTFFSV